MNTLDIEKFWNWFSDNSKALQPDSPDETILAELDRRVLVFNEALSWEVGPGSQKQFEFTISPSGQKELMQTTKAIIAKAPKLEYWEFYPAKPCKAWSPCFNFIGAEGGELSVDATKWDYSLAKYEDDTFDIAVRITGCEAFSEDDKLTAVEIMLDGILGEIERIEKISSINVTNMFTPDLQNKSNSIAVLKEHWKSLVGAHEAKV